MKKLWSLILAAALVLSLSACGGEKKAFDPKETTAALLDATGVFSEELERLDTIVALAQYGLGGYLEVEVAAYRSTGATAEEVAVVHFASQADAEAYEAWAESYLDTQRKVNRDYRPQEMPKLEDAVARRRGETFLILVCADYEAAQGCLEGSGT